jgi:hypothetical protein
MCLLQVGEFVLDMGDAFEYIIRYPSGDHQSAQGEQQGKNV